MITTFSFNFYTQKIKDFSRWNGPNLYSFNRWKKPT